MKSVLVAITVALILTACGADPDTPVLDANALTLLPEHSLISMALVNPAEVITAIDSYATGVPIFGESAVSGWILAALDCSSMDEVETRYGIDVDGSLVIFMQSMMPQSFGAALSVTNADLFWSTVGITPTSGEPIGNTEVGYFEVDFGKVYVCSTRGLLLAAGSRAGLEGMLTHLDDQSVDSLPAIPDGSLYFYAEVAIFGPMAAQQLAMFKPQLLAQMQTPENTDIEMTTNVMNLYFEAIDIFLTQTQSIDCILTFGPEFLTVNSAASFVTGSDLDELIIPVDVVDMTTLIPAGDVAVARVCLDPAASETIMTAVMSAMGMEDIPQEMVSFWSQASSSMAMSMFVHPDEPFNIVAVYNMPEGSTLQQVQDVYQEQFSLMSEIMGDMPGLTFKDVTMAEYDGIEWVTFGMQMDYEAMQESMSVDADGDSPLSGGFAWTAWLTEADGILYMEMNDQPLIVPMLISGTWEGGFASSLPEMSSFSDEAEFAMLINLPEYMNMIITMSGLDIPAIDSSPVWIEAQADIIDGGIEKHFRVNGSSFVAFLGQAVQTFSALASIEN